MVQEQRGAHPAQWAAICSTAEQIGCSPETRRLWVRRTESDTSQRPGLTSEAQERLQAFERENRELKRANEILRKAGAFFAATKLNGYKNQDTP